VIALTEPPVGRDMLFLHMKHKISWTTRRLVRLLYTGIKA